MIIRKIKSVMGEIKHVFVSGAIALALMFLGATFLVGCKNNHGDSKGGEVARFIKSAETYRDQGQLRAAMLEAKNAIQKNPGESKGYIILSDIYNQLGAYAATQALLEPILPKMPEVSLSLAEAYIANKKYRSALNILVMYKPNIKDDVLMQKKDILVTRCSIYLGDKASVDNMLIELNNSPKGKVAAAMLAQEYLVAQGNRPEIDEKMQALLAENPANIKLIILAGDLAMQQNDLVLSENLYTKALGLLPKTDISTVENSTVLAKLIENFIRQGKSGEA